MTDNIEKKFFDTFGIEPRQTCTSTGVCNNYVYYNDCNGCNSYKYPQITDRILLELICIVSQSYPLNYEGWSFNTAQELKETILEDCIKTAKRLSLNSVFANNIQQLFKN